MQYLYCMQIYLDEPNEDGITLLHILADCLGRTPLHRACAKSNFKQCKILIEHGVNVNAITDENESPLTILASQN